MPEFDGHSTCFIVTGYDKAYLIDFNYKVEPLPGKYPFPGLGPFDLLGESNFNYWGKMMFKWVYWNLLLTGSGAAPGTPDDHGRKDAWPCLPRLWLREEKGMPDKTEKKPSKEDLLLERLDRMEGQFSTLVKAQQGLAELKADIAPLMNSTVRLLIDELGDGGVRVSIGRRLHPG